MVAKSCTVRILVPLRRQMRRTQGLCYGVSLLGADRASLFDADYQLTRRSALPPDIRKERD